MYSSFVINYDYVSDTPSVTQYHMNFYNKLPGGKKKGIPLNIMHVFVIFFC